MSVSSVFIMWFPLIQSMFLFIQPAPQKARALIWRWFKSILLISGLLKECLPRLLLVFFLIFFHWQKDDLDSRDSTSCPHCMEGITFNTIVRIKHPCQYPIICYAVSAIFRNTREINSELFHEPLGQLWDRLGQNSTYQLMPTKYNFAWKTRVTFYALDTRIISEPEANIPPNMRWAYWFWLKSWCL